MMTPQEVVAEVLQLRRAKPGDTSTNRNYTHDTLCQVLQERLIDIGDCFGKYSQISYLVQGPRDQGIDVLLKLGSESGSDRFVGFQVKSYREITSEADLSKNLKAALHDATSHYGEPLIRYYILFFGDTKTSQKRISATTNEFTKDDRVRVLDEQYCRAILDLNYAAITAVVDHFLRKEDKVLRRAKDEVEQFEGERLIGLISCLSVAFDSDPNMTINTLSSSLGVPVATLDQFEGLAFYSDVHQNTIRIAVNDFPAVRALYYDLQVRHEMSRGDLVLHLSRLLAYNPQRF